MRPTCDIPLYTTSRFTRAHSAIDRLLGALSATSRVGPPDDWWHFPNSSMPACRTVAARDPFRAFHDGLSRLLDDLLSPSLPLRNTVWYGVTWPETEVIENDNEIVVRANLPGLNERDIDVHLDDRGLTIRAERSEMTVDHDRRFAMGLHGRFERRIPLPTGIDTDLANAEFRDGVLTVTLPRAPAARLREKGAAVKRRLRSWWSRLRGKDTSHQS